MVHLPVKTNTKESDIDIAVLLNGKETKKRCMTVWWTWRWIWIWNMIRSFSILYIDYKNFLSGRILLPFYKNVKEEGGGTVGSLETLAKYRYQRALEDLAAAKKKCCQAVCINHR